VSVSVIICCHNSQTRIESTLRAVTECRGDFPIEVILVDNASTDSTAVVARSIWSQLGDPFQLRIISETRPGKVYAQRTGTKEARNELIVFCDDDNWLSPDYLILAKEILSDPKVGAASGQAEPVFEGQAPTFVYSHGSWLALGIQSLHSGDVTETVGYVWGAGMVARRADLIKIYECPNLPILSGPSGVLSIARGDDNELCWAIVVLGRRLIYDERLKIKHFMPRERLTLDYLRKRATVTIDWDAQLVRRTVGLKTVFETGDWVLLAFKSAMRWARHAHWEQERRYHRFIFLAACGIRGGMTEFERKLYEAHKWLLSARDGRCY
jgi:glycosyltransferase involved in cell wall biosynthesis